MSYINRNFNFNGLQYRKFYFETCMTLSLILAMHFYRKYEKISFIANYNIKCNIQYIMIRKIISREKKIYIKVMHTCLITY